MATSSEQRFAGTEGDYTASGLTSTERRQYMALLQQALDQGKDITPHLGQGLTIKDGRVIERGFWDQSKGDLLRMALLVGGGAVAGEVMAAYSGAGGVAGSLGGGGGALVPTQLAGAGLGSATTAGIGTGGLVGAGAGVGAGAAGTTGALTAGGGLTAGLTAPMGSLAPGVGASTLGAGAAPMGSLAPGVGASTLAANSASTIPMGALTTAPGVTASAPAGTGGFSASNLLKYGLPTASQGINAYLQNKQNKSALEQQNQQFNQNLSLDESKLDPYRAPMSQVANAGSLERILHPQIFRPSANDPYASYYNPANEPPPLSDTYRTSVQNAQNIVLSGQGTYPTQTDPNNIGRPGTINLANPTPTPTTVTPSQYINYARRRR